MTKLFQISTPDGMSTAKLDSQGRATVQYSVKNFSQRPIDGRAVLLSIPRTTPPSGAVEKGWVTIDGKPERHFDIDKEETYSVKIAVPPRSPAGNYSFRLDTVWIDKPDEGDQGPTVAFAVSASPISTGGGSKLPLIILIIVLVLVVGGVTTWLILRKRTPTPVTHQGTPVNTKPSGTTSGVQPGHAVTSTSARPSPNQVFLGNWTNVNPNAHSISRLDISKSADRLNVHVVGSCGGARAAEDCDLGNHIASVAGGAATANWDTDLLRVTLTMTVDRSNRLICITEVSAGGPAAKKTTDFFEQIVRH